MEPIIKPIETVYAGYRFRSRLEARWAVFFDTLGVQYEYEPEGFELAGGLRYLPDFRLPEYPCWIEVKGQAPTEDERTKAGLLADHTNQWVGIVHGSPWPGAMSLLTYHANRIEHNKLLMKYINLAIAEGDYPIISALRMGLDYFYWHDVERRIWAAQGNDPATYVETGPIRRPYNEVARIFSLCPSCNRLMFGTPAEVVDDIPDGETEGYDEEEGVLIKTTFYRPASFPARPGWCNTCETFAEIEHPRLIAAYVAARQARFEYGESGARS